MRSRDSCHSPTSPFLLPLPSPLNLWHCKAAGGVPSPHLVAEAVRDSPARTVHSREGEGSGRMRAPSLKLRSSSSPDGTTASPGSCPRGGRDKAVWEQSRALPGSRMKPAKLLLIPGSCVDEGGDHSMRASLGGTFGRRMDGCEPPSPQPLSCHMPPPPAALCPPPPPAAPSFPPSFSLLLRATIACSVPCCILHHISLSCADQALEPAPPITVSGQAIHRQPGWQAPRLPVFGEAHHEADAFAVPSRPPLTRVWAMAVVVLAGGLLLHRVFHSALAFLELERQAAAFVGLTYAYIKQHSREPRRLQSGGVCARGNGRSSYSAWPLVSLGRRGRLSTTIPSHGIARGRAMASAPGRAAA